ncbi:DNA polymerase III subunit beta [Jannaschia sp. LMIT008]|uniref:DNA polymerase III subunit beta n=1 Tax=Jannaschia maritima TaxID=3032585 RepID=UPI0028125A6D|nr:DNA polymerase III subunit beta [Jannaschia sp. LMIT008]
MKFSIERAALLKAVSQAQSVVERRNTIPILANILLDAEGDTIRFRATDLDIEVIDRAPAKVDRAGGATVSAQLFHEIVRKLPDGALVAVEEDGAKGRVSIAAGRSRFELATLPKDDFPAMASEDFAATFTCPAPTLRRLFDKSRFAISTEETRYYLNGVYLHVAESDDGRVLRAVATDGHRLARVDAALPEGAEELPGVIVPRKAVVEIRKLLDDDEADITVSVSETKIRFATESAEAGTGITLTSKVIDGTFPDYARVIPAANPRKLEVDAAEFARAVDRVATVSSERSRAVKLSLDEDRLVLSVNAPDSGAAEEELAVAYADEKLEIGFNAKYLQEIAQQVDRENAVFMFNNAGDPTLMREGDDPTAIYVVMPMRV